MKILIYGAGVIGSLYGACLSRGGCEVAVFARGRRLAELQEMGLLYRDGKTQKKANVTVLDKLAPWDRYDYIFLTVRAEQVHTALRSLRENVSPTIVTMVNTLEDYSDWEELCGKGRILPAFPGAGGSLKDGVLDGALTPRIIQPTTFAEINGSRSERVLSLKEILTQAGIACQIVPDMHAWQICHLAMVVPLADAYYMADDPKLVHRDKAVMRKTAQALHDNFTRLKERGDAISPPKLNLFRLCPVSLIAAILPIVYNSSFGDMFMYRHSVKAREEMAQLHQVFYGYLNDDAER
ncbi:MAG: ketopantoate reductase family protein [Oscillospiraceae bacterium]|nr:ketopantoate reductase family protein [Oscillospiraceae bacterium]